MKDHKGYYEKYKVERTDGKPVGMTFTLEVEKDPYAIPALRAYQRALAVAAPQHPLVADLTWLIEEAERAQQR